MTDAVVGQSRVRTAVRVSAADAHVTQSRTRTVFNLPSQEVNVSQSRTRTVFEKPGTAFVSQTRVRVVAKGQFDNPEIRAWGFSQDGHDFYVLRLGMQSTLVYDTTTGQWAQWDGSSNPFWRAQLGMNWIGVSAGNYFGGVDTPVITGDDSYGFLWSLDPTQGYDDDVDPLRDNVPVVRAVRGGIPFRGRHRSRTNGVWLTISNGAPVLPLAAVTLRTSDDQGVSWQDRGSITVTPSDYNQQLYWRSLGLMRAPGRLFEFEDNGAMIRIDSADVDMSKDDQGGPSN